MKIEQIENLYYTKEVEDFKTQLLSQNPEVLSIEEKVRPPGYRLSHSLFSAKISLLGQEDMGWGDGLEPVAKIKAKSEGIERAVYHLSTVYRKEQSTSSGWACHIDLGLAKEKALFELIERDVAVHRWLTKGPFFQIPRHMLPMELIIWEKTEAKLAEFFNIRVLLSSTANGACVSVLLLDKLGRFVVGHASGRSLESTIISASMEAFRAAHLFLRFSFFSESMRLRSADVNNQETFSPGAHFLAYAYKAAQFDFLEGIQVSENEILIIWEDHLKKFESIKTKTHFEVFKIAEFLVVHAINKLVIPIFWGLLNCLKETAPPMHPIFSEIKERNLQINFLPHFVG